VRDSTKNAGYGEGVMTLRSAPQSYWYFSDSTLLALAGDRLS
jgi:hypothetical protein